MTRSHKANDPIHNGNAEGAGSAQGDSIPRNFGKHAAHTEPPNRAKKNGGGKANWGRDGDELLDETEFSMHNARRRSNSKGHIDNIMKSKFEVVEAEPVFDESMMSAEHADQAETASSTSESTDKST